MNLPQPQHSGYTLEDWKQWDGRWELIHGMAYDMTPSPGTKHQEVSGRLAFALESALREVRKTSVAATASSSSRPLTSSWTRVW
jgi:Uma2 family endonuclease